MDPDKELLQPTAYLSKGINIWEHIDKPAEFELDIDFQKKQNGLLFNMDQDLYPELDDGDNSEDEDPLKTIEETTEKLMLSSPEYFSFKELAAKMIDCIPNGDVKILIIEEGDGVLVPDYAEVTFHYAAYWEKANIPFDSTLTMNDGKPVTMRLHSLIPGLQLGLVTVRGPSARFLLLLQPAAAWGKNGAPPRILPDPALFVVSLYSVNDTIPVNNFHYLPSEEKAKFEVTLKTVQSLRTQAKIQFSKTKYRSAIKKYQEALNVLTVCNAENKNEEEEIKKLKVINYVNLAVCYCKIDKPKYAINMCKNLNTITPIENHCKALYNYGKAHQMLGKDEDALVYYKKALKLEPKNIEIGKQLAELDEKLKKNAVVEKEICQKAFQNEQTQKVVFAVDEDFENGVRDMCLDLAGRNEYVKFDLPTGLTKDEVDCIKSITTDFEHLVVLEDGDGKRKKVSIVKKTTH